MKTDCETRGGEFTVFLLEKVYKQPTSLAPQVDGIKTVWKCKAYRVSLIGGFLAWHDVIFSFIIKFHKGRLETTNGILPDLSVQRWSRPLLWRNENCSMGPIDKTLVDAIS